MNSSKYFFYELIRLIPNFSPFIIINICAIVTAIFLYKKSAIAARLILIGSGFSLFHIAFSAWFSLEGYKLLLLDHGVLVVPYGFIQTFFSNIACIFWLSAIFAGRSAPRRR